VRAGAVNVACRSAGVSPASRQEHPSRVCETKPSARHVGPLASRRHRAKNTRAVYGKPSRQGGMSEPLAPPASRRHRAKNTRAVYAKPSRQRGPWERRHRGATFRPREQLAVRGRGEPARVIRVWLVRRETPGRRRRSGMRCARPLLPVHGYGSFDVGCRQDAGAPRWSSDVSGSRDTAVARSTSDAGETPAVRHAARTALAPRTRAVAPSPSDAVGCRRPAGVHPHGLTRMQRLALEPPAPYHDGLLLISVVRSLVEQDRA
jgi:hypothetical protein